jgi:hypothetical protein
MKNWGLISVNIIVHARFAGTHRYSNGVLFMHAFHGT